MDSSNRIDTSYSPYSFFVNALNDISTRWNSVSSHIDNGPREFVSKSDPEARALNDYFSGKVPQQGSNIEQLVAKFVV